MSTIHEDDEFDRLLSGVRQMDDDALDALVAGEAAEYNAPPARPPVDAMWAHIAATRKPASRGGIRVQRWQLLAASVAFIAFGITIGRQWTSVVPHAGAPAPRATHASPPITSTPSVPTQSARSSASTQVADAGAIEEPTHHESHSRATSNRAPSHAAPRVDVSASDRGNGSASSATRSDAAYQLATMRHFVAAEALLASYDGTAHDAKTDAQLASWASDLLSQTRLLIDSPAGRDPVRRRLLQDLELVLVQMAQLGPGAPKLEHDLIDGSVRHNDIITRLRSAVPAGATTAL